MKNTEKNDPESIDSEIGAVKCGVGKLAVENLGWRTLIF